MTTTNEALSLSQIFGMNDGFRDAAIIQLANAEGVFDMLVNTTTAAELAKAKGWQLRKTEILLDSMATLKLINKLPNGYINTATSTQFLARSSAEFVGDVLEHSRLQWSLWNKLPQVLASTTSLEEQQEVRLRKDANASEVFNRAMKQLADGIIPEVGDSDVFKGKKHVIDLAGGHGYYLTQLAKANPELTGEVWDFETTRPFTEKVFADNGVADRLKFHARDIGNPASFAGSRADVVMVNDCMHYFTPEQVQNILTLGAGMLGAGGRLVVITPNLHADKTSPKPQAIFSFYMMVNTANGGVHSTDFIASVVRDLCSDVKVSVVGNLEDSAFIVGTKRA